MHHVEKSLPIYILGVSIVDLPHLSSSPQSSMSSEQDEAVATFGLILRANFGPMTTGFILYGSSPFLLLILLTFNYAPVGVYLVVFAICLRMTL